MILHLALAADWALAQSTGEYHVSSRGRTLEQEGFIHCSTVLQIAGVAERFYADAVDPLLVLEIDDAAVAASGTDVRWEGDGELFPHIYGPIVPDFVAAVRPATIIAGRLVYQAF